MRPNKFHRRAAQVYAWQITDEQPETLANELNNQTPDCWDIKAEFYDPHASHRIIVSEIESARSTGKPPIRFFLRPSDWLVLEDGRLWRVPAPLFYHQYERDDD